MTDVRFLTRSTMAAKKDSKNMRQTKDAWLIDKGHETHVDIVSPRLISRVSADETEEEFYRRLAREKWVKFAIHNIYYT